MSVRARSLLVLGALLPIMATGARAQQLTLTTTAGNPIAFPTVTEANYDAGSVAATALLAFTLDLTKGGGAGVNRHGILSIRASSALMGGAKPIGDLQWRRSDLATWNNVTTTDVQVESRAMVKGGLNDPWSNSIQFRTLLSWSIDGPATYTPTIVLTATITTP